MCFEYSPKIGAGSFMGEKKKREAVPQQIHGWSASQTNGFENFRTNHQTKISMLAQYHELDGIGGFTG